MIGGARLAARGAQQQRLRQVLLGERGKTTETIRLHALGLHAAGDMTEREGAAVMELEAGVLAAIAQCDSDRVAQIDEAIERLEQGQYGVCQDCGKAIGDERLAAVPYAALCVHCQRAQEATSALRRPVRKPPSMRPQWTRSRDDLADAIVPEH